MAKKIWYNLPLQIKEIIKPIENQLSDEVKNIMWFNLPNKLSLLYKELNLLFPPCAIEKKFMWFKLPSQLEDLEDILNCTPPIIYNFDVTANWLADATYPVTDQASFELFLGNRSYNGTSNLTNIVITNFSLVGNKLTCILTAEGTVLDLSGMSISESIEKIGVISELQNLYLNNNQIVTFNPTIALPSSLTYLALYNNQIVTFNPTIALPIGVQMLYLNNNQIVTFNPTIALPSSLMTLGLTGNQMTTQGYTNSEVWANNQPAFTSNCNVTTTDNVNSISGTNLETILISKNCTVSV